MGAGASVTKGASPPPIATPEKIVDEAPKNARLGEEVVNNPNPTPVPDGIQKEDVEDRRHNRDLREKYSDKAYKLATGCLSMWAVMLGTQGAIKALTGVEMWSDKVIIAVTTGVTVSVLAAFLGVIRGLFGNGKDKK